MTELLAEHRVEKSIGDFAAEVHSGPALVYLPRAFQYAGETFGEEVSSSARARARTPSTARGRRPAPAGRWC